MPGAESSGEFDARSVIRERSQCGTHLGLEDVDAHGSTRFRNGEQPLWRSISQHVASVLRSGGRTDSSSPCPTTTRLLDRKSADCDLAGSRIGLRIKGNLLALLQRRDTRALERGGVYEHVPTAIIRLDEAKTFMHVVEFHGAVRHDDVPSLTVCT